MPPIAARLLTALLSVLVLATCTATTALAQDAIPAATAADPTGAGDDVADVLGDDPTAVVSGDEADPDDASLDGDDADDSSTSDDSSSDGGDQCATKRMRSDAASGGVDDGPSTASGDDDSDAAADSGSDSTSDDSSCARTQSRSGSTTSTMTLKLASVLKRGRLDAGTVSVTGAGRVVQTLTEGCSARPQRTRTVLGRSTHRVTKAQDVHMSVALNGKGKATLRRAKGKVCVTLTTRIALRGKKPRSSSRTVWLTPTTTRAASGS